MRTILIAILLTASAVTGLAARNNLKPSDFEPLTSLPWKKPGATLEGVLDAIFRETNPAIRYPVLAEYLRTMPVGQLGKAFDICIDLEGTQTPDDLVEFFLPIWAKRDPKVCWKRTKELFRVVGIEPGWLGYDSWKERPRITVQDLAAIRASRFWIENRGVLASFGVGVENSSLSKKERVRLMKEFINVWFNAFGSWPGYRWYDSAGYKDEDRYLIEMLDLPPEQLRTKDFFDSGYMSSSCGEANYEVGVRRRLQADPAAALEIIKRTQEMKWPPPQGQTEPRAAGPSTALLMMWAKADRPAMVRWAESLDIRKEDVAAKAKGLLMSRVDAETRGRWLADAKSAEEEQDRTVSLLREWAGWDPTPALDAARGIEDGDAAFDIIIAALDGPWNAYPLNPSHSGLGFIKEFDPARMPEQFRANNFLNWEMILEVWGDIDIGETARYGLDFLLRTNYAPRKNLIKFFSGEDGYTDDAMVDRTFCSLRVWAVVKPGEMKAWIATLKDAEMRKALTWLLQHPWGTGPKE